MNRRGFLAASSMAAVAGAIARPAMAAQPDSPMDPFAAMLADPPRSVRPQIRWWWPGGTIKPEEVTLEARQIADAGFGGFEIADVRDSVVPAIDPDTLGWGTPAWNAGVEAALEEARAQGLMPSVTLGPHWPTGIPGVRPDDDAAAKELVHGMARLDAGARFKGAVPGPVLEKPSGTLAVQNENPPVTNQLVAVQAYRLIGEEAGRPVLDPESRIDLTGKLAEGAIDWRAPSGGEWLLMSFWMRGTGQIQNMFGMNRTTSMLADPVPYVLDIYGPAAVEALTAYWDDNLLTPRIRELMRETGGTFFEDSLEMSMACPWTPTAIEQFAKRRGYDVVPYLPLLVSRPPTMEDIIAGTGRPQMFEFAGVSSERVRHDLDETLSAMYVENRLQGLGKWAKQLGMKFRVQAIGSEINSGLAAAYADVPEGDNSNDIHGWRKLAAGRDIGGHTILSDEAATFVRGIAHVADWGDALYMLQRDMVGGANQIMLHGFSYADAPGATWPGFSAFGRSIGNDWGPRDPQWTMAADATAYLGRMQALLRDGRTQADLAVLGAPLKSQSVLHAGFTFQYPAMELFDWPRMAVTGGVLMPEGPAYRALVINGLSGIDLSVARKLRDYVEAGLPIVIVGKPPSHARSWNDAAAVDAEIARIFEDLAQSARTRMVAGQRDVVGALAELGLQSRIGLAAPHRILAQHRVGEGREIYYLLNDSETPFDQTVSLAGSGRVYLVDLSTGKLVEQAVNPSAGRVAVPLALAANEPAMIVIADKPIAGAVPTAAPPTGEAMVLGDWQVRMEDWMPPESGMTTVVKTSVIAMPTLRPWQAVEGFKGMAGVAHYATSFRLKAKPPAGATIDLGQVEGSARIIVNGSEPMPVNPFSPEMEIGRYLRRGTNMIEIAVASPLNNRLLAENIGEEGFKPPINASEPPPPPPPSEVPDADPDMVDGPLGLTGMQPGAAPPGSERIYRDYGLIGPVTLKL